MVVMTEDPRCEPNCAYFIGADGSVQGKIEGIGAAEPPPPKMPPYPADWRGRWEANHRRHEVPGPTAPIDMKKLLAALLGGSTMMSKRLSPALTFHNAVLVTADGMVVWHGDLTLPRWARVIEYVAELYSEVLYLYPESGPLVWYSKEPDLILSRSAEIFDEKIHKYINFSDGTASAAVLIRDVLPKYEEHAKRLQRQWALDRGLVRRTPKEVWQDVKFWVRCKVYEWRRAVTHLLQ